MTTQTLSPYTMSAEQKQKITPGLKFWNGAARKYAKSKISDVAGYRRSLARTRDYLSADDHVLELGCGTGSTALEHAPHVQHITGTDLSDEMIAIANEKVVADGPINAEFVVAEADNLPFANQSFDAVMAHNLLHLVTDIDDALKAAKRVVKKNGFLISKNPCLGEMNPLMKNIVLPIMRRFYGIPVLHTFTIEEHKEAIIRAGFTIEEVEFHGTKGKDYRPFIVARAN
ncbi:MAG: class I SAM-dependent methyltransferase [Pseudomonadota bacterium]